MPAKIAKQPEFIVSSIPRKELIAKRMQKDNLHPKTLLPPRAPTSRLDDKPFAQQIWKKLIRLYSQTKIEIITGFDWTILENFCLIYNDLCELERLSTPFMQAISRTRAEITQLYEEKKFKEADRLTLDLTTLIHSYSKLDIRILQKIEALTKLGNLLYLSPKSRAGVAPTKKKAETVDELEALLNDAEDFIIEGPEDD